MPTRRPPAGGSSALRPSEPRSRSAGPGRSSRPHTAPRRAAKRDADGGAALQPGSHDALGQLRQRVRPGRAWWSWWTSGGQRGADAPAGPPAAVPSPPVPLSPARIARLKRFDANWQAAVARIDAAKLTPAAKTDLDGLKSTIADNLFTARRRDADDGAGDRHGAVRAEARSAGRSAHPRRGHERSARRRDDHRRHQGDRAPDGDAAAREPGAGDARRDRGRSAAGPSRPSGSTSTTATTRSSPGGWGCRTRRWTKALKNYAGAAARHGCRGEPHGSRRAGYERLDCSRRATRSTRTCRTWTRSSRCRRTRCATSWRASAARSAGGRGGGGRGGPSGPVA